MSHPLNAMQTSHLEAAIKRGAGGHNLNDILDDVRTGHKQLWLGEAATAVTQIMDMPRKKVCQILLAGGDFDELLKMEIDVSAWAQAQGCTSMMQSGRRGWTRRLGSEWREVFTVMERNI